MNPRYVFLFLLVFISPAIADAGGLLYESYIECVARLGKPVEHASGNQANYSFDVYNFVKGAYKVSAVFFHDRVHVVRYEKLDEAPLTHAEFRTILNVYGDGQEWRGLADGHWITTGGGIHTHCIKTMTSAKVFLGGDPVGLPDLL